MKLKAIAAIDEQRGIGKDQNLLYNIAEDMRHFVQKTGHDPVIMRRGTFASFGSRPLRNRLNIVISRQDDYEAHGASVVSTLKQALDLVQSYDQAWIIGGAGLYQEALPYIEELEITQIFDQKEADTFFPPFKEDFECISSEAKVPKTDLHPAYQFQTWQRKKRS